MTYQELVDKAKDIYQNMDAGNVKEHVAIQFNIEGEAAGAFYLEISEGKVVVEPYEYYDRDVLVTTTAAVLTEIAEGKLDIVVAYTTGKLKAEGDLGKALLLKQLTKKAKKEAKKEAKKAAKKK